MNARPASYRTLASLSRITLLFQLQQRGTMTIGDLADATGLHPNTAREHLDRLVGEGFVTVTAEHRDSKGRPRKLYSAAAGADHGAGSIREAKLAEAQHRADQLRRLFPLKPAGAPETAPAGHCSGSQRQMDALEDHLDRSGFNAELDGDGVHMHLRDCPYIDMVRVHPEVCGVHFGLIQGVLDQAEGPLQALELHVLEGPNLCTVDLETRDAVAVDAQPAQAAEPSIIIHGVSTL